MSQRSPKTPLSFELDTGGFDGTILRKGKTEKRTQQTRNITKRNAPEYASHSRSDPTILMELWQEASLQARKATDFDAAYFEFKGISSPPSSSSLSSSTQKVLNPSAIYLYRGKRNIFNRRQSWRRSGSNHVNIELYVRGA